MLPTLDPLDKLRANIAEVTNRGGLLSTPMVEVIVGELCRRSPMLRLLGLKVGRYGSPASCASSATISAAVVASFGIWLDGPFRRRLADMIGMGIRSDLEILIVAGDRDRTLEGRDAAARTPGVIDGLHKLATNRIESQRELAAARRAAPTAHVFRPPPVVRAVLADPQDVAVEIGPRFEVGTDDTDDDIGIVTAKFTLSIAVTGPRVWALGEGVDG